MTGRYHSLAVTDEGEVYSWGLNDQGQLGRSGRTADTGASCTFGDFCHDGSPGKVQFGDGIKVCDM